MNIANPYGLHDPPDVTDRTCTTNQLEHQQLVEELQELRRREDELRHRLRNLWLTMTGAEKATLLPPPVPLVR